MLPLAVCQPGWDPGRTSGQYSLLQAESRQITNRSPKSAGILDESGRVQRDESGRVQRDESGRVQRDESGRVQLDESWRHPELHPSNCPSVRPSLAIQEVSSSRNADGEIPGGSDRFLSERCDPDLSWTDVSCAEVLGHATP
ncbi:uncharacterized protein FYW61_020273 isoform 1-T5 [Anableps anableps]